MHRMLTAILMTALAFPLHSSETKPPKLPKWIWVKPGTKKIKSATLTRSEAITIAVSALARQSIDVAIYEARGVMYCPTTKRWFVGFEPTGKRKFGDHCGIEINEIDKSTRFIPGQ